MPNLKRPLLHFYLADQKRDGTSSRGIWNVSRCLLREMAKAPDPGWDVVFSVHPNESPLLAPPDLPAWMRVVEIRGPRLWLDHVWCPIWSLRKGVTAVFFPKGWMPLWMPRRIHSWVLLHDAMNDYYARVHPGYFPKRKTDYFRRLLRHSYRKAHRVFVNSHFTGRELERVCGEKRDVDVLPLADPLPPPRCIYPRAERRGLLVLSSPLPHKCTHLALKYLEYWLEHTGFSEPILVVGDPSPPAEATAKVRYLGRLSDEDLSQTYAEVRSLIDLSEMEGFGLPLREAYARGTPVVFRDAHAFHEAMGPNAPGAWDAKSGASFSKTLHEVLELGDTDIQRLGQHLQTNASWSKALQIFWKGVG